VGKGYLDYAMSNTTLLVLILLVVGGVISGQDAVFYLMVAIFVSFIAGLGVLGWLMTVLAVSAILASIGFALILKDVYQLVKSKTITNWRRWLASRPIALFILAFVVTLPLAMLMAGSEWPSRRAPITPLLTEFDNWLASSYRRCWSIPSQTPDGEVYVPSLRVVLNQDGSLVGEPDLVNPPSNSAWDAYVESAKAAVVRCNPLHFPPKYAAYYDERRIIIIHFDPRIRQ
jgi:hypothetical protein